MRIIDLHCYPGTEEWFQASIAPYAEALTEYWGRPFVPRTAEELLGELESTGVEAMLVAFDAETVTGRAPCTNDYVAALRDAHPERIAGVWGSVDPLKGAVAIREAERAVKELGVVGFHFHPIAGDFDMDDARFYPLWDAISGLGAAIMVDTGTTGVGARLPGGGGRRLKRARPFPALDDLAVDFPQLTIVAAHPSWPWTDEMIAIALHKANVYWELSGWGPEYFPEALKHDIPRRLQDKVMFGSDYPSVSFSRTLDAWHGLGFRDEILEKVFHANAERVLGV
ncbi:MAG: amidohydrolase family protein [Actinomycetota bacterium]|nr:amidohydrolase family protein [Actinomycetota bacterium]